MKKLFTFFVAAIICSGISTNATTLAPIPYTQNFENGGAWPTGWSTDNPNVWSMSTTWNGANNPGGYNVYSDYNPLETGTVFSPGFDGSVNLNIHVKFYHYWRADYSGNTQDGYLWGSRDGGLTYPYLLDEWHHNNPATEEGEKIYDISSWADGYNGLTFKWVVSHNNDWYWQFDNFEIYEVATPGLWTGAVSTSWNTAGNWDNLTVPTSTVSVTIPSGTPHSPYVGYGVVASCNNLTINSGATLTHSGGVVSNSHLNVYGDLNSDYGTFTQSGYAYLYFRGNTSAYWDDDNMDDTYRNVRIIKTNSTDEVSLWQHMTIERNLEIVEGTFLFSNNWTLTINSTASNALEIESGGILKLANSQTIDVAGDVQFLNGSQANITGGLIRCSGDFRVEANTSYDIHLTGGLVEMFGSLADQYIEDQDGNTEFYNLLIQKSSGTCSINYGDLNVNEDLSIAGGTLNPNNYNIYIAGDWSNTAGDAGFDQSTGRVIFDGPGPGMQHINSDETFNILENNTVQAIRIENTVTCSSYDWTSGNISVSLGTFIANDLVDNGIYGNYYALTNSEIHLHQDELQYLDLYGDIMIYGNGIMKVYGGTDISYWCLSTPLDIDITSGGVLDFVDIGIKMFETYPLTYDLEGGTIRTGGGFTCQRTDFYPTGSTFEFYGGTDANISIASGSILYDVIINKSGGDKSTLKKMARNGNIVESTKSNTVVLSSNIYLEYELIILEGELTLNGNELLVHDGCSIYGTLNMTDPADVLSISWSGDLTFYSGSTGNISNGKIYLHKWIVTNSGCSFTASTNNTIYFVGDLLSGNGGMANYEPSAVYGNIILTKIVHETQLGASATEPHIVNGNFVINEGSTLVMQDKTLIVHGIFTDHASSKVYVHNTTKDGENSTSSDKGISAVSSEYKGGYLEIDNDFTLTGLLDVGDGDVLLHSNFGIAPTGVLTINGGSFIADQPNVKSADPNVKGVELQDTKDWQYLQGTINLTSGLFEISHNSFYLSSTATTNITGGIIRAGGTFLAYLANNFQPTAGTVELIGEGVLSQYIALGESNYFHDLVIDRTNLIDIYNTGYDLHINNDFTILGGGLDTKFWDIYIGGDWTNNVGASAFVENTNTVTFTGTNDVSITTGETFYNLTLDKSSSGDWLTLSGGNVTAYGDLIVNGGALHTGAFALEVHGNVNIKNSANLFVQTGGTLKVGDNKNLVAELGSSFYIEGSPSSYATLTNHVGNQMYSCDIFGEIAANYAVFEFMGLSGINIKEGATVNSIYTFNNCIFQNGAPAPSALLTLNNDQVFTCNNAHFENTFGNTQYNVWKHFDTGNATFQAATGDFAGPEFEADGSNRVHWTDIDVDMDLTVMLEGPFNGTGMTTDINSILPGNQPFNSNPLADWYYMGTEYVSSMPSNVTDWILVELRDASSASEAMPGDVVAKQAALLLNNGSIVDLDGISNLTFPGITYSSALFPVVWHRNHLGIISSDMMTRTDGVYTYDFTQAGSAYSNTNPGEKLLGGSIWGMLGGDSNGSGLVALGDLSNDWTPYAGETGYRPADYNLDGQLNNKDKNDVWVENLLKLSQIPGSKKTD
ncbi:MAG: hypothetical protein IMY70_01500 [Bacteroidetes bacterium]|nr:hypothetical protein [Bacteroidota bacterium]